MGVSFGGHHSTYYYYLHFTGEETEMDRAQASGWTSYSLQEGREVRKLRQSVPKPGLTTTILVKEKAELNSCFNRFSVLVQKVKTNKQISGYTTQHQGELWREIEQRRVWKRGSLLSVCGQESLPGGGGKRENLNEASEDATQICGWKGIQRQKSNEWVQNGSASVSSVPPAPTAK